MASMYVLQMGGTGRTLGDDKREENTPVPLEMQK